MQVGIREQDKYSQTYAGPGLDSSRQVVVIRVPGDHTLARGGSMHRVERSRQSPLLRLEEDKAASVLQHYRLV
jgi:hypothetical protein